VRRAGQWIFTQRQLTPGLYETAQKLAVAVHEEVRKFWEANYSANLMRAALVSRHSLDELEALAREKFGSIANKELPAPEFSGADP